MTFPTKDSNSEQLKKRSPRLVYVRVAEPMEDIEVELVIYNSATLSGTSVMIIMVEENP